MILNSQAKHSKKIAIHIVLLVFSPALIIHAQDLPDSIRPIDYPFARNRAIGGGHTGLDGDFYGIFINPASMVNVTPQKTVSKLSLDVNYADLIFRIWAPDRDMPQANRIFVNRFNASADVGGPIGFGVADKNYAFGVFNVTRLGMDWDRNVLYKIAPTLTEEIILAGAFGFRLHDDGTTKFDIGFTLKGIVRAGYNHPPLYLQEVKYIFQNMMERTFETQVGGGGDIGLRWTLADSLSFAAVFYDPYSPVWVVRYSQMEKMFESEMMASGVIPIAPRATVGVSWRINSYFLSRFFSRITLSCDYTGLLDNPFDLPRDPVLNLGAGIEVCMHEVFNIRAGFRDMLPSAGLGIDFTFMNIDVSAYGSEMGQGPAQFPVWAAAIDITFKL